jgi:hypothetical protein
VSILREFFEIFGELSVHLSIMEALVSQVLESLIDQKNPPVGGLLINELTLFRKLANIRTLAGFRFAHNKRIEGECIKTVDHVDEIRVKRNSFVHGMWSFDPDLIAEQKVRCLDPRWEASKGIKHWARMHSTVWSFNELRSFTDRVRSTIAELSNLKKVLETATMVGVNSPEELRESRD